MKRSERLRFRPMVSGLEDRRLLTAPITEFPIPAGAVGITSGPDGNLWFTLVNDQIGRITPVGQVTVFPIPHSGSGPSRITSGPDGNLWFTYAQDLQIGRMTPTGQVTMFPYGADHSSAAGEITGGPDGNVWFTEVEKVGRITPAGQVTEFSVPSPTSQVTSITPGPDGNLWFSETTGRAIGRITPAGQITEFPFDPVFPPSYITFGLDGILWATTKTPVIYRMTQSGRLTQLGNHTPLSTATGIALGPDANLWLTEGDGIGRITPAGLITPFLIPTSNSAPSGIALGPDGNLWFSERNAAKIGRFRVSTTDLAVGIPTQPVTGVVHQPLTYSVTVINNGPNEATDVVLTQEFPPSLLPVLTSPSDDSRSVTVRQGTVTLSPSGFVASLGNLPRGATATATIVLVSSRPFTVTSRFTVHANESDTNPGSDAATLSATIGQGSSSSSPHVLSLRPIRVKRKGLTAIVIGFDRPMNPGRLLDLGIYHLVTVGKGKKSHSKVVGLSSASYDATSHSVRLSLKKPVKTGRLRPTIDHSGVLAADGIGLSGGDYVAIIPK